MHFPVPAIWSRQAIEDPSDQIDRVLFNRSQRLIAGLAVADDFSRIDGALIVTLGHGKYLRLQHSVPLSAEVPPAIAENCRFATDPNQGNMSLIAAAFTDLAEVQAGLVEKLKSQAGKYVDRVMAVAVTDPGIWPVDFDGRAAYLSFCNAARLAELSGLTVIDAFPERDIAAGGRGRPLDAMPLWLMLADRNPKVARQNKAILISSSSRCYWLPASDGLDAELPLIAPIELVGFNLLHRLEQIVEEPNDKACQKSVGSTTLNLERLYCDGRSDVRLQSDLQQALTAGHDSNAPNPDVEARIVQLAESYLSVGPQRLSDLVRTAIVVVLDHLLESLQHHGQLHEMQLVASQPLATCITNRFGQQKPEIEVHPFQGGSGKPISTAAITAAILGLMYIDQMPSNIPWLTGADSQRILGRLTPGRPGSWRQLVRSMADFHPPAMKLKDAI